MLVLVLVLELVLLRERCGRSWMGDAECWMLELERRVLRLEWGTSAAGVLEMPRVSFSLPALQPKRTILVRNMDAAPVSCPAWYQIADLTLQSDSFSLVPFSSGLWSGICYDAKVVPKRPSLCKSRLFK